MNEINLFLSGGIAVQYLVACLFFHQYKAKTGDSLFSYFAAAFLILATEKIIWLFQGSGVGTEFQSTVYLFRLFAFVLIIVAIVRKNLARKV